MIIKNTGEIMMFFRKKTFHDRVERDRINLNCRWFLDVHGTPYTLFDRQGMIINGLPSPLGYSCKHRTNGGFCEECWEKFIQAGLKAIRRKI